MNVRIVKLHPDATVPVYQTTHAAAADLTAALDSPMTLQPGERGLIPTGLAIAVEPGYELQVRARSGLALKQGLALVNGIGTIDADYRGEVGVIAINLGTEPIVIESGMRVAQAVVAPSPQVSWQVVDELDATDRGAGGFGSTGFVDQSLKK